MASARATTMRHAPVGIGIALASLLLLLIATAASAAADAETGEEPGGPVAARANQRIILECTTRCVTQAMGCATTCARARPDEAPVCAAACVQSDVSCLAGCSSPQQAGPATADQSPPAPVPPAAA